MKAAPREHESPPLDARWRRELRRRLTAWFRSEARDLPWRHTRDPYAVWVSEIMLQQTQVATVERYFVRFMEAFPTVADLAAAPESQVLRLWEGLGYYRRARQLHAAARLIVAEHNGEFPRELAAVLRLPGIGRYTAGAILSIALDEPLPILEANTYRLLARLLAMRGDPRSAPGQAKLWNAAEQLVQGRSPGLFNQALMELGALVCTPREPSCGACPVAACCLARREGLQAEIPPPLKKPAVTAVREAAVLLQHRGRVLIVRCSDGGRWAGLWDFPRFALPDKLTAPHEFLANVIRQRWGQRAAIGRKLTTLKHGVTRYRITLEAYAAQLVATQRAANKTADARWVRLAELDDYPLNVTARRLSALLTTTAPNAPAARRRPSRRPVAP